MHSQTQVLLTYAELSHTNRSTSLTTSFTEGNCLLSRGDTRRAVVIMLISLELAVWSIMQFRFTTGVNTMFVCFLSEVNMRVRCYLHTNTCSLCVLLWIVISHISAGIIIVCRNVLITCLNCDVISLIGVTWCPTLFTTSFLACGKSCLVGRSPSHFTYPDELIN